MYLSRLYITGYRSIAVLDLSFTKGKNVLVGRNNGGKSNIVRALDLVLGENSPTWERSDNITENDFHAWKETNAKGEQVSRCLDTLYIWCELKREPGEALNYNDMYKCPGFYVHSRVVSRTWPRVYEAIRLQATELPADYQTVFAIGEDDSPEKEYVNPKLRNQNTFERQLDDKYHFAFAFIACKDEDGKVQKQIRFLYRESEQHDWVLAFRAPIRSELIQSAIVPSFRDPQNQLRLAHYTWYGKLMRHLTATHAKTDELQSAFEQVRSVADGIFASVKTTILQSSLEVAFPDTDIFFQFNADTQTDLYKSCVIYVDDGFRSQLTEKGSGIQSATIIGLFNYYTQYVNTVTSALLCIEEPEIYLHPHARRVICDRLDDFLASGKNQVILTTHSAEFIRTTSPDLNVILICKDGSGTQGRNVCIDDFKDLLLDNNQNELFFADKVIVCEGLDGYILRIVANQLFPGKMDEQNISIVPVGGKDRISHLMKLVLRLGLKCFILADFDYLLRDKSSLGKNYGAALHESVLNCGLGFFAQDCVAGANGAKLYGKIAKMRNSLKDSDEAAFYLAKQADDFQESDLFSFLSMLRTLGIGILSAQIENCSKDDQLMSPNKKLDLETVFKLNARLNAGESIDSMLDTAEICEFLAAVFSA